MNLPGRVTVVEVGPRDGLQNEPEPVATPIKIEFVNRLSDTGLSCIEVSSFVSPAWIPQLADATDVYTHIEQKKDVVYPVLVPNERGMERALEAGAKTIAIFNAASETFNQKNINASIAKAFQRLEKVAAVATSENIAIRGYVSCVLGCPYEGAIDPATVGIVARDLFQLGCYEISLGDTIGIGTPLRARRLLDAVTQHIGLDQVAVHFHDTRGQALANVLACLEYGVTTVDASVAGLGGCPYAEGASGNLATEDLVYMLHGMEIETGIDLDLLIAAGRFITKTMGREPASRLGRLPKGRRQPRYTT
ncbi:MAG: hydroxymethylglutaryl-CoA lyase [Gammaproteobacteria bacterium]|nr:hydroxymethylglutaryl-CoA lyase [Gammaproteobacteria bacterium]